MAEGNGKDMASGSPGAEISALAGEAIGLARDDILMHLRFFAPALAALPPLERPESGCMGSDGRFCLYDPVYVLKCCRQAPGLVVRVCLHMLLHCIFSHGFQYEKLDADRWDLAADLAVESVVLELGPAGASLPQDTAVRRRLQALKGQAGTLTAEGLYRYFTKNPLPPEEERELRGMSFRDSHSLWKQESGQESGLRRWRKLGRQVKADIQLFSGGRADTRNLEQNLAEAVRERYDYREILSRFAVYREEMSVSEEEFDYVYYTYGLSRYGNLPLIEPLEYREARKVKEFVVAIDTSASCDGEAVKDFLRKTYAILKGQENFFARVNIHILQCDSQVRDDARLTCEADLEAFIKAGKLTGFGATDFRPVFAYVEKLREAGEFENLKGLIYFTDGYGIYPERMPDYQVLFAFPEEDENRPPVPPWSMKVVM